MAFCEQSVQIDDFDDRVVYSGPWQAFTDQTFGSNGTRHVATAPGLSANFKFNGSCLIVNGIVGVGGTSPMPPTTFILDGHFSQMNGSVMEGATFPGTKFVQSVFYMAFSITEGAHELIITNIGGSASNPLMLDGFIITPLQTNTSSSSAASSPTTNSSATTLPSTTLTSSLASASPSGATLASSSSSRSHTGTIVGGVVAGVGGFLVLALLACLVLRSRRRRGGAVLSDIRPFAAWRGHDGAVPPNSGSPGVYPEKNAQTIGSRSPDAGPKSSGLISPGPDAPVMGTPDPAPHPNEGFYTAPKTRPPHYAP